MLREAQANCDRYKVRDFALVQSDDALSKVRDEFDLVHSCLALQHIPWSRGKRLIDALLTRVRPGGFIAAQFYHRCNAPRLTRAFVRFRYAFTPTNYLRNLWKGRPMTEPAMELHIYDLPLILHRLRAAGFTEIHQFLGAQGDGAFESTLLFARRAADESACAPRTAAQ
jgi:hypothetical protein